MTATAAFANISWLAASLPEWRRFRRDAGSLEKTQRKLLASYVARAAKTRFGMENNFSRIRRWEDYADRVAIRSYDEIEPWIERIKAGETGVLTQDRVSLLEPSSGSSGAKKLIPYTPTLQAEFRRGVATWVAQLFLDQPRLLGGRAYWSLTPQISRQEQPDSRVPVGFDEDSAYLGGIARRLINQTIATTPALRRVRDMDLFWHVTLLMLLRCRDLRLISVWHPSYLTVLLAKMKCRWPDLLNDLHRGIFVDQAELRIDADPRRATELRNVDAEAVHRIWPKLGLISCWGDAHAAMYVDKVRAAFPAARIESKGLVATEAFVTLPVADQHPLAVRSHFFEFVDDNGQIHPSWTVEPGEIYTLVITTGGGLYRYRLHDRVQVTGFFRQTPSLKFLGKDDSVCDYFGEKLSEPFVASVLSVVTKRFELTPKFAMLAMDKPTQDPGYTLYIECDERIPARLAESLEVELRQNPHYDLCIRLGQLRPVAITSTINNAYEAYTEKMREQGLQLGDIKPAALSRLAEWHACLAGQRR